ncbi:MAG TPA: hypothetical protein DCZ59_02630 [Bacteroidetes bacterium]|nr:hypothetical protein [Bacteroidota bacterium]
MRFALGILMTTICIFALCVAASIAQPANQLTTGTHFRVGFIHPDLAVGEHLPDSSYCLRLHADEPATVSVGKITVKVVPGQPTVVCMTQTDAVEVTSNRPITVSSFQDLLGNGEQSWHLPTSAWGRQYRAFNWWTDRHGLDSASMKYSTAKRLVIANENDTHVTAQTLNGERDTVLDAGQVWLLSEALDTAMLRQMRSDPTGLLVSADKPVAVISGHAKAAILAYPDGLPMTGPYARTANRCRGNLQDAMYPTSMAGTEFVTVPIIYTPTRERGLDLSNQGIGDDRGDVLRFIALSDSTVIMHASGDGSLITDTMIARGQVYTVTSVEKPMLWHTSQPALAAQYGKSYGRITSQAVLPEDDPTTDAGLPLLMTVPPLDRWISRTSVHTRKDMLNVLAIAVRTSDVASLRLNTRPIASTARLTSIPGTIYSVMTVILPEGTFTVTSDSGKRFACWTYGSLDGFQLGKIYGSVAGVDVHTSCPDSIHLSYAQDKATGLVTVSTDMVWLADTCSWLSMLYLDSSVDDATWQRIGTDLLIQPKNPQHALTCTAIAVSSSGRRDSIQVVTGGTNVEDDNRLWSYPAISPMPIGETALVTGLSSLIGRSIRMYSLEGAELLNTAIIANEMTLHTADLTRGTYVVAIDTRAFLVVKL